MPNIRRALLPIAVPLVVAACASVATPTPPGPPADVGAGPPESAGQAAGSLEAVPGDFDISRVALMSARDLPDAVPVPVPAGGRIDESAAVFEGNVLVVDYDPRFLRTAAAFYETWFRQNGLAASPMLVMGGEGAGWEVDVGGVVSTVQLSITADEMARLEIFWP